MMTNEATSDQAPGKRRRVTSAAGLAEALAAAAAEPGYSKTPPPPESADSPPPRSSDSPPPRSFNVSPYPASRFGDKPKKRARSDISRNFREIPVDEQTVSEKQALAILDELARRRRERAS
jgi:hypothetical protein